MMITLKIGSAQRSDNEIEEKWISEALRKRINGQQNICVQFIINNGDMSLTLSSVNCSGSFGGEGEPNHKQKRVIDLWRKHQLDGQIINTGMIVSFLKQLNKYL